jgi:hypothetical protein
LQIGQKRESGLSAVSLRPCEPLALIPVNGQEPEIGGGDFWIEKWLQHAPLGLPGADPGERKFPFSGTKGWIGIWCCIRLGGHTGGNYFVVFLPEIS